MHARVRSALTFVTRGRYCCNNACGNLGIVATLQLRQLPIASHFLTSFSFKKQGLVEGEDVLSVLARAEYYLNEKNLDSATRELNQLKGTARILLTDWLDAARKRLEVLQALEVTLFWYFIATGSLIASC